MPTPTTGPDPSADRLDRILDLARRHLRMDVAYVAAFEDGMQSYRALAGDAESFGMAVGSGTALATTYCELMVADDAFRVIPDTGADPRAREREATRLGVGAYVGVPLRLGDGTLYGTFCCLSHEPDPALSARDADFMRLLADFVVDDVAAMHERDEARRGIRRLVDAEDLTIALQPVVDLRDGTCLGVEALSRFPAPFRSPDVVFAAAHEAGVGLDLERLAVRRALEFVPRLGTGQFLAVNVAPDVAVALAAEAEAAPEVALDRVVVEITEHAAVESYAALRDALAPLRDRGLRVAIDDAGAGYASLHHVVELRPDVVKIDRSLVAGLAGDPARRAAVSSFVLLGAEFGALVLAEGVEEEEDLATARRLGVAAAQGYLLARPSVEDHDHERWLRDGGAG